MDTCRRRSRTQNGYGSEPEPVRRTESDTHVRALPASAMAAKRAHDVVCLETMLGNKTPDANVLGTSDKPAGLPTPERTPVCKTPLPSWSAAATTNICDAALTSLRAIKQNANSAAIDIEQPVARDETAPDVRQDSVGARAGRAKSTGRGAGQHKSSRAPATDAGAHVGDYEVARRLQNQEDAAFARHMRVEPDTAVARRPRRHRAPKFVLHRPVAPEAIARAAPNTEVAQSAGAAQNRKRPRVRGCGRSGAVKQQERSLKVARGSCFTGGARATSRRAASPPEATAQGGAAAECGICQDAREGVRTPCGHHFCAQVRPSAARPWPAAALLGHHGRCAGGLSEKDAVSEVGPTPDFCTSCILTGMHGQTCIFWADLTPCSLWRSASGTGSRSSRARASAARSARGRTVARSHCRSTKRGTEYDSESGIKRVRRWCKATMRPSPRSAAPRCARSRAPSPCARRCPTATEGPRPSSSAISPSVAVGPPFISPDGY